MEKVWCGTRGKSLRGANTFFAQDGESDSLIYTRADIKRAESSEEIKKFIDYWGAIKGIVKETLVFDSKLTRYDILYELDTEDIKFITLRTRSKTLIEETLKIPEKEWQKIYLPIPKRKYKHVKVHESTVVLIGGQKAFRQLIVKDHGRAEPTFIISNNDTMKSVELLTIYARRWHIGASREGRITQSAEVRPRLRDSRPCSLEGAVEREQDGEALRQHSLKGGCATLQVVTHSERRCSLVTRNPVAETVDNARRQQGIVVKSHVHYCSPAGYQRRHEAKGYAETGEVLGVRRRNLDEEASPITVRGKWWGWHQDGGSGGSTGELRAAKRARREAPGPVDIPLYKVRQG